MPARARPLLVSALVFVMAGSWSLAVPVFSAPDEHAHAVRAGGVYSADLLPPVRRLNDEVRQVPFTPAPAAYGDALGVIECYLHRPARSASCAPALSADRSRPELATFAGRYPPAYYLAVGAPTRVTTPSRALYAMRLISAALFAGLIAAAFAVARRANPAGGVAVLAATTPVGLYLGGVVNPNGLEVAAAIATWSVVAALAAGAGDRFVIATGAVAASALVLTRSLSPLWLGAIFVAAIVVVPGTVRRDLVRSRPARLGAGLVAVSGAAAVAWIAVAGAPQALGTPLDEPLGSRLEIVARRVPTFFRQAVGDVGYLDAPTPALVVVAWLTVVAVIVGGAVRGGAPRRTLAVVAAIPLAAAAGAVILETVQSPSIGLFWQGRYLLPLLAGVPILALAHVALPRRVLVGATAALAAAHVVVFAAAARRYTVGVDGPLAFWSGPHWSPPVPALALLVAFTAAAVALAVVVLRRDAANA